MTLRRSLAAFDAAELGALVPRLRRYARALAGSKDAADDLTQDTLERAWSRRSLWQPGTDLRAWLFTVMHNLYVNGARARRPIVALEDAPVEASTASAETGAVVNDLARALARLPDEQRSVLLLIGLEQFSYAEASAVLGVPLGTVMSRLARGRDRLRILLYGDDVPSERAAPLRRVK